MIASDSHTAMSPSTSAGTLPAGLYLRIFAFHSGESIGLAKGISTSSKGMPKCFIRIQGLRDHDEWHLLPMTRVGMMCLPPLPKRMRGQSEDRRPIVSCEIGGSSNHEAWPLSSPP